MVALLRAVNVGGQVLRMADLQRLLERLGYEQPRTLLQSGNAIVNAGPRVAPARVESQIEAALQSTLSLASAVLCRTRTEWDDVIAGNPFTREAADDPARLMVVFLKRRPAAAAVTAVQQRIAGRERLVASGRQLYVVYPDGVGRSKLTGAVIERTLGTAATARNWNTVTRVAAALATPWP